MDHILYCYVRQAQRERLRLRNEELESGALQQQHQLATLTHQVSDLQQDNVKLYEKIRFLQSCGVAGRRREEAVVAVETRYQVCNNNQIGMLFILTLHDIGGVRAEAGPVPEL